jgi:hypothetical protein
MRVASQYLQRPIVVGLVAVLLGCGGGGGSGKSESGPGPAPSSSTTSTMTEGGSTTTTVAGEIQSYTVTFGLADAVTLGSLQVEVDYSGTAGDVVGSGGSASCTSPLSAAGALVAFGDDDATSTLNIAALALTGFDGPTSVASCELRVTGSPPPLPDDFVITVVEANAVDTTPVTPLPAVIVSNIAPR